MNLYAVRNKEGKYFRAIGYGGSGPSWVDDLEKAKLYTKKGQAKSRVTFFFKNYPKFGCPELVVFTLIEDGRIDMTEETQKSILKAQKLEAKKELARLQYRLETDKRNEKELRKSIENLNAKVRSLSANV